LNQVPLVINSDLIEHVEITPDTVIALTTGQKILVLETADEVIERVVRFRRSVLAGLPVGLPMSQAVASPAVVSPAHLGAPAGAQDAARAEEEPDGEE
jgi:flagellar protein FlbD